MKLFSLNSNTTLTDIQWQTYPIGFFLLVLCLFTIIGNLLIIYAILADKTLHTSKYYYIASLAFADVLVGLIVMPFAFIFKMTNDEYWLFSGHLGFFCDFWHAMDIFASTASIFGLCAIGIDRYVAITKPIEYPNSFICKRWYYLLAFLWICSAAISFPAVIHFGTEQVFAQRSSILNETKSIPLLLSKECDLPNNPYYILFISITSFYLPLIVMIYVYIRVYSVAKKQLRALRCGYKQQRLDHSSRTFVPKFSLIENSTKKTREKFTVSLKNPRPPLQLTTLRIHHGTYQNPSLELFDHDNQDDNRSTNNMRRKKLPRNEYWKNISGDQKAEKFVGIVMGVFVLCWLPYFVYFILSGVFSVRLKDEQNHKLLYKILSWLGYTNSALDVVVYIFTSKELRMTLLKLCCKL